jgi:hypothetical protein
MPLSDVQKAALSRLQSFYEGDNPYNSVTNPGGFRQNGHLYNFVPALKDIATVITGVAAVAVEVATNSAQSPKAVRVDGDQTYTDAEKAQGQKNLGLAAVLTSFVAKAGGTMTGPLGIAMNYAAINLTQIGGSFDKQAWAALINGGDGKLYFQKQKAGAYFSNALIVGEDGSVSTAQFGDLNARIEARAAAFADGRIAKTGDTMTGQLGLNYLNPAVNLRNSGGSVSAGYAWNLLHFDPDGRFYLQNSKPDGTGVNAVHFGRDGSITTAQIGDLNTRIETRAKAFADAAQAAAAGESVSLAGDTMTGGLAAPLFQTVKGNANGGLVVTSREATNKDFTVYNSSNRIRFYEGTANLDVFSVGSDGSASFSQFGDLNARIEARGAAYSQAAKDTSVQKNAPRARTCPAICWSARAIRRSG